MSGEDAATPAALSRLSMMMMMMMMPDYANLMCLWRAHRQGSSWLGKVTLSIKKSKLSDMLTEYHKIPTGSLREFKRTPLKVVFYFFIFFKKKR